MKLIETINYYVNTIFSVSIITLILFGAILFYLLKVKKVTAKTEVVDYSTFEREDTLNFVKFENVISEDADDMGNAGIIDLGNNSFVAGISVTGYNYASASVAEKERTMANAIAFANRIISPIQMRQTVKAIDLTHNIAVYEEAKNRAAKEHMTLLDEYNDTVKAADDYIDDPEMYAVYEGKIEDVKKRVMAKEHAVKEADAILRYMTAMTEKKKGDTINAQKINQIMFSYTFNPAEYSETLSQEEIYLKAMDSLSTQAASYGEGLLNCGYTYKRLSAKDLLDLMRKHMQPYSGNEIRIEDIFDSSMFSLFVSSNSLVDLEIERKGEEEYVKQLEENRQKRKEFLKKQRAEAKEIVSRVEKDASRQADLVMQE